jgi:hypothetical protein
MALPSERNSTFYFNQCLAIKNRQINGLTLEIAVATSVAFIHRAVQREKASEYGRVCISTIMRVEP